MKNIHTPLYLVTGGCGFIGSHLCEALLKCGRVRILDNLSSGHLANIDAIRDRVEWVQGDVRDMETVRSAMAGVDYVFHEAALVSVFDSIERPRENHEINVTGTLNVLTAAQEVGARRVVMASSAAVYGNDPELPKREFMCPQPESPYAIGKISGEYYMRIFHTLYGLETVSLRYFNVYGPRQDPRSCYSGVISRFVDDVRAGRSPTIFGDGGQSRDFVYVKDVVSANILAMHNPDAGRADVFNVATGRSVTLLELVWELEKLVDRRIDPIFRDERAGDIRTSAASVEWLRKKLGFVPAIRLHAGLAALMDSFSREGAAAAQIS